MRISDWSSDVCSSDLLDHVFFRLRDEPVHGLAVALVVDERADLFILGLEVKVIIFCDGGRVTLGHRVRRDVLDDLAADLDLSSVPESFQILFASSHFISAERRVRKECVSKCRLWLSPG